MITYKLSVNTRPIIEHEIEGIEEPLVILWDTGAQISTFNGTSEKLYEYFPNAKLKDYKALVNWFGRPNERVEDYTCDVYVIDDFYFNGLLIKNLNLALKEDSGRIDLILASDILTNHKFSIDYSKGVMEVEADESNYIIGCRPNFVRAGKRNKLIMTDTMVLTQAEVLAQQNADTSQTDDPMSALLNVIGKMR